MISAIYPHAQVDPKSYTALQLDLLASYGNSGGPVFCLETGVVLGIINEKINNSGFSKAVPINVAKDFMRDIAYKEKPGVIPDTLKSSLQSMVYVT